MTPRPATELLLFDCDGVLVDSEPVACRILAELLSECGLPTTSEESMRFYRGRTESASIALASEKLGRPLPEDFGARLESDLQVAFEQTLRPIPGVAGAIEAIAARGLATCVASSGSVSKMQLTLGLTGLLAHFDGRLFSATDVARSKPHPDVFLHAAEAMGASPARCCVVEDSPLGVEAAVAAGMRVLGYARDSDAEILSGSGARVFYDMAELPGLVDEAG
jgi:HAD superfamily hydrolase (TIGR01509 family)